MLTFTDLLDLQRIAVGIRDHLVSYHEFYDIAPIRDSAGNYCRIDIRIDHIPEESSPDFQVKIYRQAEKDNEDWEEDLYIYQSNLLEDGEFLETVRYSTDFRRQQKTEKERKDKELEKKQQEANLTSLRNSVLYYQNKLEEVKKELESF